MANRKRAEVRSAVHRRIRRKVRGTTERPRLAVYRSLNHIYAQVIDDEKAQTLASASTTEKKLGVAKGGNIEAAKRVGQAIAERALAAGIESVVFDRGGYLYHGRVRALTDAARAAGLNKNEVVEAEAAEAEKPEAAEAEPGKPEGKQKKAKPKKEAAPKEASTGEAGAEPKPKKEAAPKEASADEAGAEPKARKEAAPKEGTGEAGAEPKPKKEAAPKEASTGEASAEPKARKEAAPKEDKEASEAEAGSPPETAELKDTVDSGEQGG